ncbi:MAG: TRAP transporter small permease [Candidatus Accumulibacter sp.]|nr:TRAP transporter small permease [Accumulibacter sp.]
MLALFAVIIVSVSLQVFYRYVLNDPLTWSEELARFSFMWMVFLGLGLAERDDQHIAVDFFVGKMPSGMQKIIRIAVDVFCIVVLAVACYQSLGVIRVQAAMRSVALNISMAYFAVAVPIGFAILCVYKFLSIARIAKKKDFASMPGASPAPLE